MILGLFTGLLTAGGIQRISRHTAAVIVSFAKEKGKNYRLLSLNDPVGVHGLQVDNIFFFVEGFDRHKWNFALAVLAVTLKVHTLVLAHPNLAPLGLLVRLIRPRCRSLVATYGIDVWSRICWWRRFALQKASLVTALSSYTGEKLLEVHKVPSQKIRILPPALDPDFSQGGEVSCDSKLNFPKGKILLTVARLAATERYKGIETVIQAIRGVLVEVPDIHYVIIGDGDNRTRLEDLVQDLGLEDRVLFLGIKRGMELATCYQACDIFVMPSKKEGFGLVFIEAMAFGKPVVGGKHAGTLDVIVEGKTGFMVKYGDVQGLAECLVPLLKDEKLRNRLGEAGRRRVQEHYTFSKFKEGFYNLLNGEKE